MSRAQDRMNRIEKTTSAAPPAVIHEPINVIDFATNPDFLGFTLFPRQATVLKLLLLAPELLTDFDHGVIEEWAAGWQIESGLDGSHWAGMWGIPADILDRVAACISAERWTFREMVLVLGRRASKTILTAIVFAWVIWKLLLLDDPQKHFGLPPSKRILLFLFSTTLGSAARDLFSDIIGFIQNAPCFQPFVDQVCATGIRLYTPAQIRRGDPALSRRGLIELKAAPTVASTARGPAAIALALDEAAHIGGAGSTSTADEVRTAAKPALVQFSRQSCVLMPSTPWSMTGAFYEAFQLATEVDPTTGVSKDVFRFALQLPSWSLYLDHDWATDLELWPGGPHFPDPGQPHMADGEHLDVERRQNPASFRVEYEAQFVSGRSAYFDEAEVARLFGSYRGEVLINRLRRTATDRYVIHCDPASSRDNFAVVVAHGETVDGQNHKVIDHIHVWRPSEFPGHKIDFNVVLAGLLEYIEAFRPELLTFDNHEAAFFRDRLDPLIRDRFRFRVDVSLRTTTQLEKFVRYERLKTMINLGEVHAPAHSDAVQEARFLQRDGYKIEAPSSGPCVHDDTIDSICWAVDNIEGRNSSVHHALSNFKTSISDVTAAFKQLSDDQRQQRNSRPPNPARFDHRRGYRYG